MRAWLRASLLHTLLSGSAGVSEGCHRHVNQRIVHQFEHLLREGVQPLPPDTLRLAIGQQVTTGSVLEPCREVLPHETVSDCPNETRATRPGIGQEAAGTRGLGHSAMRLRRQQPAIEAYRQLHATTPMHCSLRRRSLLAGC